MHDTASAIGRKFFALYGSQPNLAVLEVGSQDVNGTLRAAVPQGTFYVGIDIAAGSNVDLVCSGRQIALADGVMDLAVASSVFEHDPLFWVTFLELCRITKPGGYIYINAPSNGIVHRYPFDCWRFYPDAAGALVAWARLQGFEVDCVESFTAERSDDMWNDFVAVFARGPVSPRNEDAFVCNHFASTNIARFDRDGMLYPTPASQDARLLSAAIRALLTLEARAADIAASAISIPGSPDDIRGHPHVHKMKHLLGGAIARQLSQTGGPGVPPGDLGPFQESFEIINDMLDMARRRPAEAMPIGRAADIDDVAFAEASPLSEAKPQGYVDVLGPSGVCGWVWDALDRERRLSVTLNVAGATVATVVADQLRPDLEQLGYGDGHYGFSIALPGTGPLADAALKCVVPSIGFAIPIAQTAIRDF